MAAVLASYVPSLNFNIKMEPTASDICPSSSGLFRDLKLKRKRVHDILNYSDSDMASRLGYSDIAECDQQSDASSGSGDSAYVSDRTSDFDSGPPRKKSSSFPKSEEKEDEEHDRKDTFVKFTKLLYNHDVVPTSSSSSPTLSPNPSSPSSMSSSSLTLSPSVSVSLSTATTTLSPEAVTLTSSIESPLHAVQPASNSSCRVEKAQREEPQPSPVSISKSETPLAVPNPMFISCSTGYLMQLSGGFTSHPPSGMKIIPMMGISTPGIFSTVSTPMFIATPGEGYLVSGSGSTSLNQSAPVVTFPTLDGTKAVHADDVLKLDKSHITISRTEGFTPFNMPSPNFKQPKKEDSRLEKDTEFISHYTNGSFVYRGHLAENPHNVKPRDEISSLTESMKQEDSDGEEPMVCAICNDKATGLHYGIITCEGCVFLSIFEHILLYVSCEGCLTSKLL